MLLLLLMVLRLWLWLWFCVVVVGGGVVLVVGVVVVVVEACQSWNYWLKWSPPTVQMAIRYNCGLPSLAARVPTDCSEPSQGPQPTSAGSAAGLQLNGMDMVLPTNRSPEDCPRQSCRQFPPGGLQIPTPTYWETMTVRDSRADSSHKGSAKATPSYWES